MTLISASVSQAIVAGITVWQRKYGVGVVCVLSGRVIIFSYWLRGLMPSQTKPDGSFIVAATASL